MKRQKQFTLVELLVVEIFAVGSIILCADGARAADENSAEQTSSSVKPVQEERPLPADSEALDRVLFGNAPSEAAHNLAPETSFIDIGNKEELGRRFTFPDEKRGLASVSFTVDCDPEERTYITLKYDSQYGQKRKNFWLYHENQQIGWLKSKCAWPDMTYNSFFTNPTSHSDFWYYTGRLPKSITEGKDQIRIHIVSLGEVSGRIESPTQMIDAVYSHTKSLFDNGSDEPMSNFHKVPIREVSEGPIEANKRKAREVYEAVINQGRLGSLDMHGLPPALSTDWLDVDEQAVIDKFKKSLDIFVRAQAKREGQANWGFPTGGATETLRRAL